MWRSARKSIPSFGCADACFAHGWPSDRTVVGVQVRQDGYRSEALKQGLRVRLLSRNSGEVVTATRSCYGRPMRVQKRQAKFGVYAGSFDPLTIGHLWMIEQGVRLFDKLAIAVGVNPDKKYSFPLEERLEMLRQSTRQFPNVSVVSFSNRYLIHYAQSIGATHILRGIRTESDY